MRISLLMLMALFSISAFADPIMGGPCVDGTAAQYFALGLAGCNATVGPYTLNVELAGTGSGTNTPGASYPSDLTDITIHPSFALLPDGFSEDFQLSFVSGSWMGIVGQSLGFSASFITQVNQPVTMILNQVTTAESGDVTAGICPGVYIFASLCSTEYSTTSAGNSATAVFAPANALTLFGVRGEFDGSLSDGSFSGLSIHADATVPEPRISLVTALSLLTLLSGVMRGRRSAKL
ncbi:MAG: hypothetical protein WBY44_27690 [Bryobacteraceae bacterium]